MTLAALILVTIPVWTGTVVSVTDGDTLQVRVALWPQVTIETAIRLLGVDTPETFRPKCDAERVKGMEAKALIVKLAPAGSVVSLSDVKADKYGGRYDARIETAAGVDLATALLEAKLAVPYGVKMDWCAAP